MNAPDKDHRLEQAISRTAPGPGPVPDFNQWQQAHPEALAAIKAGAHKQPRAVRPLLLTRVAALLLLALAVGIAVGRLSSRQQVDLERLRAELETSLRASITDAVEKDLAREMEWRMAQYATQTLAEAKAVTNQRISELARSMAAARWTDRQRLVSALEQVEMNRLQDTARLGTRLYALVAPSDQTRDKDTQ
ncbi:MAG: hypothetical protein KBE04_07255 [Phycisphaerae bacterium]|nr:hypothetical protein [Phycisphaerae bacterium]